MGPVVRILLQPLLEAYREAAGIFVASMGAAVEKSAGAPSPAEAEKEWDAALRAFKDDTYWYWGSLHPAFSKARRAGARAARSAFTHPCLLPLQVRDLAQYNPSVSNSAFRLEIPLDEVARLLDGVALWEARGGPPSIKGSRAR